MRGNPENGEKGTRPPKKRKYDAIPSEGKIADQDNAEPKRNFPH